jgi:hypothetical protein
MQVIFDFFRFSCPFADRNVPLFKEGGIQSFSAPSSFILHPSSFILPPSAFSTLPHFFVDIAPISHYHHPHYRPIVLSPCTSAAGLVFLPWRFGSLIWNKEAIRLSRFSLN